ncbi:MAG: hypothetical protein QXQ94_09605 [Candidatus Bathyarchaeia archaeon]
MTAETQETTFKQEVITEIFEQNKQAIIETAEKTSDVQEKPKLSDSQLSKYEEMLKILKEMETMLEQKIIQPKPPPRARFVFGLFTLLVGLWAANLALFNWVEKSGLYYLLGEYARYVCAYGGFAAMIFGAMLINDFLIYARNLACKVAVPAAVPEMNNTSEHETIACGLEEEKEKIVEEEAKWNKS